MAQFRELEILVAKIQAQLAPQAEVIHDARLNGRSSGRPRQVDVLVRQKIGQYEMLIVLDCKDYAKPVDVKGVEEFHGLIMDVGAHKGALVCPKGFTAAAKTRAAGLQIDLYSPFDTDPHKWQVQVTAPMICDFRSAAICFGFSTSVPKTFRLFDNFYHSEIAFDDARNKRPTPFNAAIEKWNSGGFPTEPGDHNDLPIMKRRKC
jgi:Restriction endonuclease